jgi:phage repressor protein C with HTH and peptisase S24 domain
VKRRRCSVYVPIVRLKNTLCQEKYDYFPIYRNLTLLYDQAMTESRFTHETIWTAVDRLAQAHGLSTSGLARKAGLDPTSFNRSKRVANDGKPRWPSTESVARILAATNSTLSDFLSLVDEEPQITAAQNLIPVIGYAQAGRAGFFDDAGYPTGDGWDHITSPFTDVRKEGIYALEVSGNSMEPLYRAGDRLIIMPTAPLRRGDRIVVKTVTGEVMAKELLRQTATKIELKSLNPAHEPVTLSLADVAWMARIAWVSQ